MEKLELKQIVPYLPYGVKIETPNGLKILKGVDQATGNIFGLLYWIDTKQSISFSIDCKPVLHPMSDITGTKPIYNWVLANPVRYKEPILNVKGKLSFWEFYK